jgi:hypothetical protein
MADHHSIKLDCLARNFSPVSDKLGNLCREGARVMLAPLHGIFSPALTSARGRVTFPRMDTMKLLLGATIALLLGALAVSWQGLNTNVKNTSPDELARLQAQIKELRAEQDKLQMQKNLQILRSEPIAPPSSSAEMEAMKLQLAQNKLALEQMELKKQNEERDAKTEDAEELLLDQRKLESKDGELRRARMISDALLMGRVKEYVEDAQYGGFVTFEVIMPENVQTGTILAIRRKTGILGQLKVSDMTAEGAIANPLPGFGDIKPVPGDELILPPQY